MTLQLNGKENLLNYYFSLQAKLTQELRDVSLFIVTIMTILHCSILKPTNKTVIILLTVCTHKKCT